MQPRNTNRYCRRPRALLAVLPAVLLMLAGCDRQPAEPASGAMLYLRVCSTCHGQNGQGREPAFPPLAGSEWLALGPESVTVITLLGLTGEIEVAGRSYRGFMPPMAHLSDAEIAAIVEHVGQWADWTAPPDAERVAQLRAAVDGHGVLQGRAALEALLETLPDPAGS
ncbi:MAG: cytochrome c [Wenzhouxiangellaceae bacterium]|nr:cytochrome c [Wenzhouxiangellaceae bacterium]